MQDLDAAEARLTASPGETRVGQGFDVHAFAPGDHVWLCGVRIAHSAALSGHSDADVGLHALADALYGALAEGDIGQHFPPSDPQWKGTASKVFLAHAAERVRARGGAIVTSTHAHLRSAEDRPAPEAMRPASPRSRASISAASPSRRRRRTARLYRPRRRHRVPRDRDRAAALDRADPPRPGLGFLARLSLRKPKI